MKIVREGENLKMVSRNWKESKEIREVIKEQNQTAQQKVQDFSKKLDFKNTLKILSVGFKHFRQ